MDLKGFTFFGVIFACILFWSFDRPTHFISVYQDNPTQIQDKAFEVLENKCNECHRLKKPDFVFTKTNMNAFAPLIYTQVFVKKKMPKGKDHPLSTADKTDLTNWLSLLEARY
jgi:uncharacterized membrane protein